MNRVAPASLFTPSQEGPASYEPRSPNIRQSSADLNRRWPSLSTPAQASPGAFAVRREPPHSCGGGALQRSEEASPSKMRFSAGQFAASPSSRPTRKPSNPINCNSPAASHPAQSNRLTNSPFLDLKIPKNLSAPPRKVFRLEPTPILCFHRLTINFNRTLVSVKSSKFGSITKLDSSQRIQIQPENARPATNLAAVLAAPAPSKPRRNLRRCCRVNQSHG